MVDHPSPANDPPPGQPSNPPAAPSLSDWTRRELQWTAETFTKAFITLVTLRAVAALTQAVQFPVKPAWKPEAAAPPAPPVTVPTAPAYQRPDGLDDDPVVVLRADGVTLHEHATRHAGQRWPCPLLDRQPCRDCRWLVITERGRSQCAARAMVALHDHPRFRDLGIEDVRDLVQQDDPSVRVWLD